MSKDIQELEQRFFNTFGIKPKEEKYCYWECKIAELKNVPCSDTQCPYYRHNIEYPQITDTIVLKLMCIISNFDEQYRGFYTEYKYIKPFVLKELLMLFETLTTAPWIKPYIIIQGGAGKLICEIRKIFEEV